MILGIVTVVVLILLAIALLPVRKREPQTKQTVSAPILYPAEPTRAATLRQQQVEEEATAIASEYRRAADQLWIEELRDKASSLLSPGKRTSKA
jgi:hypothetical protein